MAIDLNDEIVQDFLVEAGELLEQLGEQLVDMELRPDDADLLNQVFRGFHTVKGGAGFIGLDALVEICHRSEDVFNLLRQGERRVNPHLMDVVLQSLDVINVMFDQVREGEDPAPAPAELLAALAAIQSGEAPVEDAAAAVAAEPETVAVEVSSVAAPEPVAPAGDGGAGDEISDDEFEALLDALQVQGGGPPKPGMDHEATARIETAVDSAAPISDTISDDEFESLLNQLHGTGAPTGMPMEGPGGTAQPAPEKHTLESQPPAKGSEATVPAKAAKPRPVAAKSSQAETTVRVDTVVLDHIMNMVGELVLVRNRMNALDSVNADEDLAKAVSNLDVVTTDLQNGVMRTRMQPIKKVFGRFPRVVRDLARSLKKEVVLEMQGEDTDLDKNLVEALADPLIHLVRNSVDHGVEMPDVREAADKPRGGTVVLGARQEGDHILLTIADDGAGMDADVLRRMVVEKGLMDEDAAARLDNKGCYNLIFMPGFSTKEEISDVSGRGVGMDVVKTRISQLNGSIDIDSEPGNGTRINIKVPLTLAIVPTLMIVLGNQIFALPLVNVNEIFDLREEMINTVDGQLVARVRAGPMPLFFLGQWLLRASDGDQKSGRHVVVVHSGTQRVGFVVDQLLGQEEVVIKPLGALLRGIKGLAGATITGDGRIALILDVPSLIGAYANRF